MTAPLENIFGLIHQTNSNVRLLYRFGGGPSSEAAD
jgi:hypothetical protein